METHDCWQPARSVAVIVLMSFLGALPAGAQDYTFSQIPADGNFVPAVFVAPVINNRGVIALAGHRPGDEVSGIWTWSSSGGLRRIAEAWHLSDTVLSINDANVVAFSGCLAGQQSWGIFTCDGSSITTIADDETFSSGLCNPSINNAGTVTFGVWLRIYRASNGNIDLIYSWDGSSYSDHVMNDGGIIAYHYGILGFGYPGGIRTTAGRLIADRFIGNAWPCGNQAMNNAGAVLFVGCWCSGAGCFPGEFGLCIGCGNIDANGAPLVDVVVEPHGAYLDFGAIAINDAGMIAFKGGFGTGINGIFTGPDPAADKVVVVGDNILGGAVNHIDFSREGLNNSGQIVFGDIGRIILADPIYPAPPPGPILPVNAEPPWLLIFDIPCDIVTYTCPPPVVIDPEVAIGYDYEVVAGPNFSGVTLPDDMGDDVFLLYLWNGEGYVFERALSGSEQFFFEPGGVDRFRILGIEASANVDPNDPLAFPTQVCFVSCGHVEMLMTPLTRQPCMVEFGDFARFAEQWRASGSGLPADLDGSGAVDFEDLRRFADWWLDCCPAGWPLK